MNGQRIGPFELEWYPYGVTAHFVDIPDLDALPDTIRQVNSTVFCRPGMSSIVYIVDNADHPQRTALLDLLRKQFGSIADLNRNGVFDRAIVNHLQWKEWLRTRP